MINEIFTRKSFIIPLILVTSFLPPHNVYAVAPDTSGGIYIPPSGRQTPPSGGEITPPRGHRSHRDDGGGEVLTGLAIGLLGTAAIIILDKIFNPSNPPDNRNMPEEKNLSNNLLTYGPQFALRYNMSAFLIRGIVKGGWPIIVDFEQNEIGPINLRIRAQGVDTFTYRMDGNKIGHRQVILTLPEELGDQLRSALIAVTSIKGDQNKQTLPSFRITGIGVGPGAVGSMAIDRVLFQPSNIHAGKGETAAYRFYSHSDFDKVSVEFMKAENSSDGRRLTWVTNQLFDQGLLKDHWIGYPLKQGWDGKNKSRQISYGNHQLKVRVWDFKGDWVAAWSDSLVSVLD